MSSEPWPISIEKYHKKEVFRAGEKVSVYKYECSSKYCVIKCFNLSKFPGKQIEYVKNEIDQLKMLSGHRNIVTFYADILNEGQRYMVMEYAGITIGDVIYWEKLKKLADTTWVMDENGDGNMVYNKAYFFEKELVGSVLKQVLEGLEHIHRHNLLHRDIKPDNTIINKHGIAKIADFGSSKAFFNDDTGKQITCITVVGTTCYMAPEILTNAIEEARLMEDHSQEKCALRRYSSAVDVWSFGMMFYELIRGFVPLYLAGALVREDDSIDVGLANKILEDHFELDANVYEGDTCFVTVNCLKKDPKERPAATSLKDYEFFVKNVGADGGPSYMKGYLLRNLDHEQYAKLNTSIN